MGRVGATCISPGRPVAHRSEQPGPADICSADMQAISIRKRTPPARLARSLRGPGETSRMYQLGRGFEAAMDGGALASGCCRGTAALACLRDPCGLMDEGWRASRQSEAPCFEPRAVKLRRTETGWVRPGPPCVGGAQAHEPPLDLDSPTRHETSRRASRRHWVSWQPF